MTENPRMSDSRTLSLLPWQVSLDEFTRSALEVGPEASCCVFVVDPSIPAAARGGYASLVMAYSRADEPVCILEDGAAIVLVREGGNASGNALAERVLGTDAQARTGADPHRRRGTASGTTRPRASPRRGRPPALCPRGRSAPRADPRSDHSGRVSAAPIRRGSASSRSCSSVRGNGIDQFGRSSVPGRFGRRSARAASSRVATMRRLGAVPSAS